MAKFSKLFAVLAVQVAALVAHFFGVDSEAVLIADAIIACLAVYFAPANVEPEPKTHTYGQY